MIKLHPKTVEAYMLLHNGTLALARAERQGIRVDLEYAKNKPIHLTRRIDRLNDKFKGSKFHKQWERSIGGKKPNINSNAQLAIFLYKIKKISPAKLTKSGQGAVDEDALLQLEIPELDILLQIRKLKKIKDTYLHAFMREQTNGYIHPFFNLHLVRTFRSSSDKPNFQNIPKRDEESMKIVRKALYPRPGHQLLEVDYSGLEVRIAACYHEDPTMLKYINNPASDMHKDMAQRIFMIKDFDRSNPQHKILRAAAKNGFVFPQFYGDYYGNNAPDLACEWGKLPQGRWKPGQGILIGVKKTLSDHLIENGIQSLGQFTKHIQTIENDFWNKRFLGYKKWKERWWRIYQKYGHIDLKTGFRCSGTMSRNDATNYPIQGAAFHCLLWSFIELDRIMQKENWKTKLIGQIHDAIILDVHPDELYKVARIIKRVTCEDLPKAWPWIIVPLDVEMDLCEVDGSWAEKKEFKI